MATAASTQAFAVLSENLHAVYIHVVVTGVAATTAYRTISGSLDHIRGLTVEAQLHGTVIILVGEVPKDITAEKLKESVLQALTTAFTDPPAPISVWALVGRDAWLALVRKAAEIDAVLYHDQLKDDYSCRPSLFGAPFTSTLPKHNA